MHRNDITDDVRTYRGWKATTHLPTGPVSVTREDQAHGYTETLTFSWTGSGGLPVDGNGVPTGAESLTSSDAHIQGLSRQYRNEGNQLIKSDAYFSLSGMSYSTAADIGTAGTNYYRTEYSYNRRGWLKRTISPTGTITRTVYDVLGRPISGWIGTDDTPESGSWDPTNPAGMVKISENEYDGGGIGDGNLTEPEKRTRFDSVAD